jgi:outer membrane immunogenic protein
LAATFTQKVPWFGTIRPWIGYAAGNWLLYATGGYAYAQLDTDATAAVGPLVAANNRNETRNGWTLGGGVEVEFASHWSAKIEYLYVGSRSQHHDVSRRPLNSNTSRLDFSVIRTGVDYRFCPAKALRQIGGRG